MEKRLLLWVLLSLVILYGYQAMFPQPKPQPRTPAPQTGPQTAASPATPSSQPQAQVPPTTPPASPAEPLVHDSEEREVLVENADVQAAFTTRGAVLKSWRLKRYLGPDGRPLDLVPAHVKPDSPKPFALVVGDPESDRTLSQALFKPSADSVNTSSTAARLTFEYSDASGLTARKEFSFAPDQPYVIEFSASVSKGGKPLTPTILWGPALGTGVVSSGMTYAPSSQPIFYRDRDVTRVKFSDVPKHQTVDGALDFAGVDDHYFLSAALVKGQTATIRYEPVPVSVEGSERGLQFVSWSVTQPSPSAGPTGARFFFGPKDFDVLRSVDRELVRAIDFGIFDWLVTPLLRSLKWVNGYIGNYGWSIVALTVLINLAMFPLRHKSVVSMRRMQELQPEMKAIQDRYAKLKVSDPARQKMNVELMNLYRERGVNPASGCVPMLLTMPVLFAFYAMLSVAIELRGAPFIGWIKDLSTYDPLFITPILMGATQFVQTKMSPATGDPTQQKMMLFMPLIFMTMFIWAPSGLVLYWTVSNLWAIGQQMLTNRLIGPPQPRAVRPPAERRLKTAGGGKSTGAKERK
ncbi:MAG: membrane protein insertase YidC [Vicinamibacterales bacterium]